MKNNQNRRPNQNQNRQQNNQVTIVLFNDEKGLPKIISEEAELLAKKLDKKKTTRTQIRRFYQQYNALREKIRDPESFKDNEASVKMLISKAHYAWRGGNDAKIDEVFFQWLTENISAIKYYEDFKDFGMYFEALVGFFYSESTK